MDHRIGVAAVQTALELAVRNRYGDAVCREVLLGCVNPSFTAVRGVLQLNVIILNVCRRYGSVHLVDLRPQCDLQCGFQCIGIGVLLLQHFRNGQLGFLCAELHGGRFQRNVIGDIRNGDGVAAVLIVHDRQIVLVAIVADRTETIRTVYLERREVLSALGRYGKGNRTSFANLVLIAVIIRDFLYYCYGVACAALRNAVQNQRFKCNLNLGILAQIFDGERVGQVILNRAVDHPHLYHVVSIRCYAQNDLFALLHLNAGFGGGVDSLERIAVTCLSDQRAVCVADRFQRNELACRKVCCNCVTLGYIVQSQRQTAVALVLSVQTVRYWFSFGTAVRTTLA